MNLALVSKGRRAAADGSGRRDRLRADVPVSIVARRCDVTSAAVLGWESGRCRPRGTNAERYAQVLDEIRAALLEVAS